MELSPAHILLLIVAIVLLFGSKRIPDVMRGMGEGIRTFKEGMRGDGPPGATPPSTSNPAPPANPPAQEQK